MRKAIKNYTTIIAASQSVAEIQEDLAYAGVTRVMLEYEGVEPEALTFQIKTEQGPLSYRLPCRWRQIYDLLKDDKRAQANIRRSGISFNERHARAVAWRIIRDWVAAQVALIQSSMVDIDEVMLPYMLTGDGTTTVYNMLDGGRRLLTSS